jgi:chaperonin GroES
MKIIPLDDRIVVQPMEAEEKTAGGIVIPDTAKEKPQKGKVIAAGEGRLTDEGKRIPVSVKKGDVILYAKYGGTEIKVEGKDLLILRESDILAKVE